MQQQSNEKNDFSNSFYLLNYPFESIFQKMCSEIFKILANTTIGPVHLELFCPFASEVLNFRESILYNHVGARYC